MKLIFIHGRAQEFRNPTEVLKEWTDALTIGLAKSGKQLPENVSIEFPYYGDLLFSLVNQSAAESAAKQTLIDATRGGFRVSDEGTEDDFSIDILKEMAIEVAKNQGDKEAVERLSVRSRGFQNSETVQKILSYLDGKQAIGNLFLKGFTKDVFMYLTERAIKTQINQTVEKVFDGSPCVVVGHSLGSVVSYSVLQDNPQYHVNRYITVGSPLGINSISSKLGALSVPSCVKSQYWFNAYDERDVVALHPLDNTYFNVNPPIENINNVDNQTDNRHGISGYLNDERVALKIYEGLGGK